MKSNKIIELLKRLFFDRKMRNASWLIGEQIAQMLISFVLSILSARFLGPNNFGTLSYTSSFVVFFTSIASVGLEGVILKKIIASPNKEGDYLGNAILLRLASAIFSSIAVSVIVFALNPSSSIKVLLVFIQSFQLVFKAFQILEIWFQRFLLAKYVAIARIIASLIVSGYKIFLLATSKDLLWFAVSNTLTDLIVSFVLLCFYHKLKKQTIHVTLSYTKELLSESYHFILSGLMSAMYTQMDKIMIGQMLSDTDVGLYSIALTVCSLWMFIPNAFINSFKPIIMETYESGNKALYLQRLKKLYSAVIWSCFLFSLGFFMFANLIVMLLYGKDYLGSVAAIRVVIWSEMFALMGTAREIWILCEGKNKYAKYLLAIGAAVNLLLNFIMISIFGMVGAALATLVTQIITCLVAPLLFKETRMFPKLVIDSLFFKWK